MQTVTTLAALRETVAQLRAAGEIAFVPTMGALHVGHLGLVRKAQELAPSVIVSVFVNPTQFGPNEDLAAYPRQLAQDARILETAGVDVLWAPQVDDVYPHGFATTVTVSGLSEGLCGAARPGHFDGVATVVAKLFNQVQPDIALFGEKDWQQLTVIRRMARDLDLTHPQAERIVGLPTVREADGLAMSSRNGFLSHNERAAAAALPRQMKAAIALMEAGRPVAETLEALEAALVEAGFASVDYATLADAVSLAPLSGLGKGPARLFVAARIGKTRLIDNMPVDS
jgi:pantoate--beta-alanine ligase